MDKFEFYSIKLNQRHPEHSEGSPRSGSIISRLRSFATLRMTYLGSYEFSKEFKRDAISLVIEQGYSKVEAARSLGVHSTVLGRWVREYHSFPTFNYTIISQK